MITLQYMPRSQTASLPSEKKVNKIINAVRKNKIVLLEGRLSRQEEAMLIEYTMHKITNKFKGIELCTLGPELKKTSIFSQLQIKITEMLGAGFGTTIIGPANIIREIKKDPDKVQLFTIEPKKVKA